MSLNSPQHKQLLTKAHSLRPVVIIGSQGLTEAVGKEIGRALYDHELIKIKVNAETRDSRRLMIEAICEEHEAELVQSIGQVAVIYKKRDEER